MSDSRTITIDSPTKKAVVAGIAALCVCVIGALLVVGRGGGGTSFAAGARAASAPGEPRGGVPDGGTGRDDGSGTAPAASLERFRQCIEDQGITLPDPGERRQGERPAPTDALRQAFEACRRYLPERPFGGRPGSPSRDGSTF